MVDYARKAELMNNGIVSDVKNIQRAFSVNDYLQETGVILPSHYSLNEAISRRSEYLSNYYSAKDYDDALKIICSGKRRTTRLRAHIELMISFPECTFLTLTFTDEVLENTSLQTRKKYVERYLKEQSHGFPYVANIDFGKQNGREHYHAVCAFRVNPKVWHKFGAIKTLEVRKSSKPIVLAKYVSKLTNHGIKETGKGVRIIYSRGSLFDNQ